MEAGEDERELQKRMQEVLAAKGLKLETVKEDRVLMEQVVRELNFGNVST